MWTPQTLWLISCRFSFLLPWGIQQRFFDTPFGRLRMTLVRKVFWFIGATTASLLASILLTIVLFYSLAELASLCHSEPANGRVEESLRYSLELFVLPMVWNETSRFSMLSIEPKMHKKPMKSKYFFDFINILADLRGSLNHKNFYPKHRQGNP